MFLRKVKYEFIISLLILFVSNNCFAQLVKSYGFKGGISYAWQTYNAFDLSELKYSDKRIGVNFGLYAEFLNNSFFSIKSELDLISKGMSGPNLTGPKKEEKLDYLSFIILPNIYTEIQNIKIYAIAGPRIDFLVNKSLKVNAPTYIYNDLKSAQDHYKDVLFGVTLGLGCEIKDLFPFIIGFETRYSPDLSKIDDTYDYNTKNNSVELLLIIGI